MGRILAALFGLIVLGAVVGLDFRAFAQRQPDQATAQGYLADMRQRVGGLMPSAPEPTLVDLLPAAPDGWTRRPYEMADGTAITGTPYEQYADPTDTTTALLQRLSLERREMTRMADTYVAPDGRMAVIRIEHRPADRQPSAVAKLALREFLILRAEDIEAATPLVEQGGVILHEAPRLTIARDGGARSEVAHHRVIATLSDQVDIDILSDLPHEVLVGFLARMDLAPIAALTQPAVDAVAVADVSAAPAGSEAGSAPCVRRAGTLVCE